MDRFSDCHIAQHDPLVWLCIFFLFLAFFIGNIQNRIGFFTLYTIHLVTTIAAINYGFVTQMQVFKTQFPFILVCLIGVILLPFNMYNKYKRDMLEGKLEDANKRISELVKLGNGSALLVTCMTRWARSFP